MVCPFLSETQVHSCRLASVRKLIPQAALAPGERCTTRDYAECTVYRAQDAHHEHDCAAVCPYLADSLMQFCSAAPVTRFVPWSETAVSRCGSEAFRYCDLYLDMSEASAPSTHFADSEAMDELPVPSALWYTPNHMWLDRSSDGLCHVGIDAFFARMLGAVESVDFHTGPAMTPGIAPGIAARGAQLPAAVVRAGGRDWEIVFPREMNIAACNLALKTAPARLASDPYGRGWLFEGTGAANEGLMNAGQARDWMRAELRRVNQTIQTASFQESGHCVADGGLFETGLLGKMRREVCLPLFHELLSPAAGLARITPAKSGPQAS